MYELGLKCRPYCLVPTAEGKIIKLLEQESYSKV